MHIIKILFIVLSFGLSTAQAVDVSGITVNGEIAFDYNMLSSGNQVASGVPFTAFAANEAYHLNQAQLLMKKETEQLSFLGRLAYTQVNYDGSGSTNNKANFGTLDQVEIFYKVSPQLSVGFGRFLTTMGYESLLRSENATYGTTIAYQAIIPGYGEGLRAKYVANEFFTGTISTYNQTTYSMYGDDYAPTKTTEVSATGVLESFTWFAGYLFGKDATDAAVTSTTEKTSSSIWASYKFADDFTFALTYDSRTFNIGGAGTNWADATSAIATARWNFHTFAVRYEMIRGAMHLLEGSAATNVYGSADTVNSITLTDKLALNDNFKLYLEYRRDQANQDVFKDKDGAATKDAHLVTLGALAHF